MASGSASEGSDAAGGARPEEGKPSPAHLPLRKMISPRPWKLWGVSFIFLLTGACILATGWNLTVDPSFGGPGVARLFHWEQGSLIEIYSCVTLFLIGQVSFLIWCVRSFSLKDFRGRYRGWTWCAATGFTAAFAIATDAHLAFSETILWKWPIQYPEIQTLAWLVPAALGGAITFRIMHAEMQDCRLGRFFLWTGSLAAIALAVLTLNVELPVVLDPEHQQAVQYGLLMFAPWSVFSSLLFFARHVIHVTAEPCQARPSRLRRRSKKEEQSDTSAGSKSPAEKATTTKVAESTADSGDTASDEPDAEETAPKAAAKPKRKAAPRKRTAPATKTKQKTTTAAKSDPQPVDEPQETPAPKPAEVKASEPKPVEEAVEENQESVSMLDGPDPESLKGLSKRERRQLRKQWREAQREGRKAA